MNFKRISILSNVIVHHSIQFKCLLDDCTFAKYSVSQFLAHPVQLCSVDGVEHKVAVEMNEFKDWAQWIMATAGFGDPNNEVAINTCRLIINLFNNEHYSAKHGTAAEHVEETPMSSLMALIRPTEFGEIIEVIALIIEIIEHHQLIATVEHVGAKVNELTDLLEGNKEKNDDETSKSRRLTNERFPTFPSVERLSSYRSWLRTQLKTLDWFPEH